MSKKVKDFSHTNNTEPNNSKSNGEKFRNVCIGIAAVGTMVLPYLQFFLG